MFQKINRFDQCIFSIFSFFQVFSISQELPLFKNDDLSNNCLKQLKKILTKFSQVNFRKIHKILDQFDESIKSYIKIFEGAEPPSPGRVKS